MTTSNRKKNVAINTTISSTLKFCEVIPVIYNKQHSKVNDKPNRFTK